MPDTNVFDQLVEWLETKWGRDAHCPYCNINEWYVGPPLQLAVRLPGSDSMHYSREYFTVSCRNCGHTVLVDRHAADFAEDKVEGREGDKE